jgi:hypothetical protein
MVVFNQFKRFIWAGITGLPAFIFSCKFLSAATIFNRPISGPMEQSS